MGKKKTNQAQQLQRLQDVDETFTDNTAQTNRPSQKITEDKVNRIYDIFSDWPKADIRRALEDNDYDEDRVVQQHLQGGDSWQEVNKKKEQKPKESKPKGRKPSSQNIDRAERGTSARGGRGGQTRVGKTVTRTDRKNDNGDVTAAAVKEFEDTGAQQQPARTFKSYSEAAAVSNEPVVPVQPIVEPVVQPERKERKRNVKKQPQQQQQQYEIRSSPQSPPHLPQPSDVILPPQQSPTKQLSPERKQDSVVLPVGFNAVDVQFGSLGINDTEQGEKESHPSAPTLEKQPETQEFYGQNAWGTTSNEQYQSQEYEEESNNQYQQQYQQQLAYGFQRGEKGQTAQPTQPQQPQQQPTPQQRTSPNLQQYGKQQQQQQPTYPTHPYGGIHTGGQNPYPSYGYGHPYPYMMPNQFQYHNYPMPGNKYGQFYGQNKPYTGYTAPTTVGTANAPTSEENNLDYNKQFEMGLGQYPYYMQPHQPHPQQQQQQQQQGAQTTGKGQDLKKDARSPDSEQPQHQQAFGHGYAPYQMHQYGAHYSYMFQPQTMGFHHQYQPQPNSTQQGAQSHGKGNRDQQQQSSLTSNSTWQ